MNDDARDRSDLDTFLAEQRLLDHHVAHWAYGAIELDVHTYEVEDELPPTTLVTSGRCIVLGGQSVLLMANEGGVHILPGGRLEPGESIEDATRREVEEESGLKLEQISPIGLMVFRHRTPRPDDYPYPYPVFTNMIFVTQIGHPRPLVFEDSYERDGTFVAIDTALDRIAPHERELLQLARQWSAAAT